MPLASVKTISRIEIIFQAPNGACGIKRCRPKIVEGTLTGAPLNKGLIEDRNNQAADCAFEYAHQYHCESGHGEDWPVRSQIL
jgi:hypothetical protein